MKYFHKKSRAGFTLIELLVVIAVVGVLSGIVFQSLQSARLKSQNATRLSDIDQIDKSLQLSLTKTNASLPTSTGWQCVGTPPSGQCWSGNSPATNLNNALAGNISAVPKDPSITTGNGDYYIYNSSYAGTIGTGSYLRWLAKNLGSTPCGRGYVGAAASGGFVNCYLFIGKN